MALYPLAGCFVTPSGGTNGASVDGWKAFRFGGIPAEGQAPPSGTADAAMVVTGTGYGGPGAWQLYCPTNEEYYVRVQYQGSTYWQLSSQVTNTYGVPAGQTNSFIQDSGGMVFNVKHPYFGATGNGVTDDTAAITAAIQACANDGGGTVFFPDGNYLVTQAITLPVSTTESSNAQNVPQTPIYISAPLRLTGTGGNSTPRGDAPTFGAIINFNPTSADTLFLSYGEGTLEIDHLGFVDISSQENDFIYVTNTVTNIHDNAFHGNKSFTNAWTDVIIYGGYGATQPRGDSMGIYQGQVSRLANNACTNIRHLAQLYADASCIVISTNAMYNTCGTNLENDAAILVVGPGAEGNFFEYNDFELGSFYITDGVVTRIPNGYAYAIKFEDGFSSTIVGNNIGDSYNTTNGGSGPFAVAAYYFSPVVYGANGLPEGGSYDNVVMEGGRVLDPSIYVGWAAGAGGANMNLRACPQFISGGAGGMIYGPEIAAGDGQFFIQAGTQIVTTGSTGWGAIDFPAQFPNGVVSVVCQSNGDNNESDSAINWVGQVFDVTVGGFFFYLQNYEGVHTNDVQIAVTWQAIGC